MNIKKRIRFSYFLLLLIVTSLLGIIYLALKDFMLAPAQQFEIAQKAEKDGSFKRAERYYLMVVNSQDNSVSKIAAYYLGSLYRKGGANFPIDGTRAEMFLEQAAVNGLSQAQYELALMYDVGDKIPANREKAIVWMNKAAQQGNIDAVYSLGVWIERGYLGIPDMSQVVTLYEQAANQGHIYAMTSLVALYSGGNKNFSADKIKASYWMNKVVETYKTMKEIKEKK